MDDISINITCFPEDPQAASKHLLHNVLLKLRHLLIKIQTKSELWAINGDLFKIRDTYTLCLSQIKKCVMNLLEVFKHEYNSNMILQESRQCNLERLQWCCNRLILIENHLAKKVENAECSDTSSDNSFTITPMYLVNWIDHAFEVLSKLSEAVYKTEYKNNVVLYEQWKNDMIEYVSGLHLSIDELLLSAMTLYRYCLPSDQLVVKARCQVVLRETKALLSELFKGDLSTTVKATPESLKLPVKPSNVNVMIDVLKDVLYVLETNTNTALLALLIHCFSNNASPVNILRQHFIRNQKGCSCFLESTDDVAEDCLFVKDFDLYNERLLQIGSFAVSCSSDQSKIVSLRSGLASLEALDPHLVPALMMSPEGHHSTLLIKSWRQEVQEIRDGVFLIVEPTAFADKAKQMMHQKLLEVLNEASYNNAGVCCVINMGCVLLDFFNVYNEYEPNVLPHREKLLPLLADLDKVQLECKVVSNLFCTSEDFKYDTATPIKKEATIEQLFKRLKLLYTIVKNINALFQPKDQLFDEEEAQLKNVTHTVVKNAQTYLNSPKKVNLSKSIFGRTNVRTSTRNFPLSKLTKHLRAKNCSQLNFSVELDRLFDISSEKGTFQKGNKLLDRVRESSVLYNFSPIKNRSSMRKAVLNRHLSGINKPVYDTEVGSVVGKDVLMDENESLQLTEVLNQIDEMTSIMATKPDSVFNGTQTKTQDNETKIIHKIYINHDNSTVLPKQIWHIPIDCTSEGMDNEILLTSNASDITQPSTISTLERINDLDLVETKLNSLKSQFETSL